MRLIQNFLLAAFAIVRRTGLHVMPGGRELSEIVYRIYKTFAEGAAAQRLCAFVEPETIVIDVGANVGFYTERFAKHVGARGKVIAIEPEPDNFNRLCRALSRAGLSDRVDPLNAAAAEIAGMAKLALNLNNPADHRLADEGIPVRAMRLDDEIEARGWPRVSLIKIDVQGAEPRVLAGAREIVRRFQPALFLEVDIATSADSGRGITELLGSLQELGYRGFVLGRGIEGPLFAADIIARATRQGYMDFLMRMAEPKPPPA